MLECEQDPSLTLRMTFCIFEAREGRRESCYEFEKTRNISLIVSYSPPLLATLTSSNSGRKHIAKTARSLLINSAYSKTGQVRSNVWVSL